MKKLREIAKDTTKFANIKGEMTGRAFMEVVSNDVFIQHEIKHIFMVKPTFSQYIEVGEIYRKAKKILLPDEDRWEKLCECQHD